MKRTMVLVLCLTLFAMGSFQAGAETVRLTNQFPPSHFISKGMKFFADKVKGYTGNQLTVRVFDSAQLFKDSEVVEAVQGGLVDLALVPVNKWSGMVPAADVFETPFAFKDIQSIKAFVQSGAGKLFDEAFTPKGVKIVFWVDYGFVQFFNNVHPIRTPEDFQGLKIRTFSALTAETVKALGGSPVQMSSSEMYMALQRHTVDGVTTGMPAAVSRKLHEVLKYLTICNYATAQFFVQANLKWWNQLSPDKKEAVLKAGEETEEFIRKAIDDAESAALEKLKKAGLEVYEITAQDRQAFIKATEPVRASFASNTGTLGKQLVELIGKIQN
ncbi:MAG: TRAP transporter substrate-binding protein [Spirochaetales bacterium]